ncbi:ankyrin repeat protein [Necator americanus]|uniref:Ankyrin repeat protein n=1 Tax=Necator americanus TaxID=51031 RepID=W2SV16_NECAM|nr:ankyrin repeat protein [Necator americanus]ETN72542.1 ankyrin repeat protein [Necator americanus]
MEIDKSPVKMEDMVREYAELLRKSNDEDAKRMVVRVEGILEATDDSGRSTPHFAAVGGCMPILQLAISQDKMAANRTDDLSFGLVLFYIYPAKINRVGNSIKVSAKDFLIQKIDLVAIVGLQDEKRGLRSEDPMGWTPLMIAASAGRVEVVRYLLSLPQVDVNHRNNNLQTALHYAASRNHAEITHLLLEAGSDVNAADKFGATPLHRAASQGHDKIVHMLLGRPKIHIDARNSEGNTPLFLACEEDREDAAIALARKGASLTVKNKEEQTPLDVLKTNDLRMKLRKAEQHAQAMQQ